MDNIIWAAGFIDGEGCISLKRIMRKGKIYHQASIACGQTIKGIKALEKLKETFGGSVSKWHPGKGDRIDSAAWTVVSQDAVNCAEKILPYLVIKHGQAKLILEFGKLIIKRENQYRLTDSDYQKRDELFAEFRKLNVKGKLRLKRLNEETAKADAIV